MIKFDVNWDYEVRVCHANVLCNEMFLKRGKNHKQMQSLAEENGRTKDMQCVLKITTLCSAV